MAIRTIKTRIILAIFLVGCIPLLIGLLLASMSGMRSLRSVIGANFQTIAAQAADRVALLMQGEIQGLKLLASAPLRVRQPVEAANRSYPADPSKAAQLVQNRVRAWENGTEMSEPLLGSELSRFLLETKVRNGDKFLGLLITDRHGALVAASSEPDRYNYGDAPWWRALHDERTGQVYISGLVPARQGTFRTTEETIDIAVPIMDDRQNVVIGAIKASYRFDALFAVINQIRIGQTGHAMLFNDSGQPLICPILPRGAHLIQEALMRLIVSSQPGWGIAPDDGHGAFDTVVGFAPVQGVNIPGHSWHVFIRQHPSESYAPINEQLRNFVLIGVVMIVLLAAIGGYVASRMARPIQILKNGVEAISRGTYGGPLAIKTGDEFEDLAQAVHRMADRLQASRAELENLNLDLSRRIEEKTLEATRHMRKLEMAERLATLGKVASGIAHEINNPLGIILNRLECIEAEAACIPLPQELAHDLATLKVQAQRIERVTRSMLSLSRGVAIVFKPLDLNCIVRTCCLVAGERIAARGVRIETDLAFDLPPILGDRDRLETAVLNLINNAVDAVQARGDAGIVRIRSRRMACEEGDWAELTVVDNGSGIPADVIDHIFDPFFTTKAAGQGTGLGLFLSYGIIAQHRGRLEAGNSPDGAVFSIRLPAFADAPASHEESKWESPAKS
jgi:signal transduction histidine kinase